MRNSCQIEICNKIIRVDYYNPGFKDYVKDYIYSGTKQDDITICVTPDMIKEEKQRERTSAELEGRPVGHFDDGDYECSGVCRMLAEKLLPYSTLLMHGAAVSFQGEGVIFTAKSGTGKTTHISRWKDAFPDQVTVINGDKPFVEVTGDKVMVYGSPWCGKEGENTNRTVQLKAICIIEQAESNSIEIISFEEAFPMLFQQTYRPKQKEELMKVLKLIKIMGEQLTFYRLKCRPNVEAARIAKEKIYGSSVMEKD